ncbi:MAG: hypothetical protein AAF700_00150 [Pseudomonadota bacterium]
MAARFVWADLSMLDPVQGFYADLFGWSFLGQDYDMAFVDEVAVSALFPMPENFRALNLPSFWMSYISVTSVAQSAALAQELGAKLELHDEAQDVALLRDPLGAGFTLCSAKLVPGQMGQTHGLRASHSLHVSDIGKVSRFYETLFGWRFQGSQITNPSGTQIAQVFKEPEDQRGGYEYWSVAFSVADMDVALATIEKRGGTIAGPCNSAQGALSVLDPNGAAFTIQAQGGS